MHKIGGEKLGEIVDFCLFDKLIEYTNRIYIDKFNNLFGDRELEILFSEFSISTHPKEIKLLIKFDKDNIFKLEFNYLLQFYGYIDRWENSVIQIFYQEEVIRYTKLYREIKVPTFTLYDKAKIYISNLSYRSLHN